MYELVVVEKTPRMHLVVLYLLIFHTSTVVKGAFNVIIQQYNKLGPEGV